MSPASPLRVRDLVATYLRPHRSRLALLAACFFAGIGLQLLNPLLAKTLIDRASAGERQIWERFRQRNRTLALNAFGVDEALAMVRSPLFRWPSDLYPRLCRPAPPAREGATLRIGV